MALRQKRQSKNWYIVFEHRGRQVDESSRTPDRELAQRRHDERLAQVKAAAAGDESDGTGRRRRIRAADAYAEFIAYREANDWRDKPGAVVAAQSFARLLQGVRQQRGKQRPDRPPMKVHALGIRYLDELTTKIVRDHVAARRNEKPRPADSSIKQEIELLNKVCKHFREEGGYRVADNVGKPKIGSSQTRERLITPAEIHEMREALARRSLDDLDFFNVMLLTGLRRTEVATLTWSGVDFDDKEYAVRRLKKKKWVVDTLSMEGNLSEIMARRYKHPKRHKEYVFPACRKCKTGHRGDSLSWWNEAVATTSLNSPEKLDRRVYPQNYGEKLTPHSLRHHFASKLARSGKFTGEQIGFLLGHDDIRTTMRYIKMIPTGKSAEASIIMSGLDG